MRIFWLIVYFLILVALVTVGVMFAKDNAFFVTIKFFKWNTPHAPLWMIMLLSFIGGYLVATIVLSWKLIKLTTSRKKYINSYEKLKSIIEKSMNEHKMTDDDN
jgi:uncharacterized integral membrane protein